jgi:hypothetical protein
LEFYRQEGYYARAVKVYMLTLLNSNFEEWYMKNPETPLEEFKFSMGKMGKSGALFDLNKLNDISKNELSKLSAEEMYDFLAAWANEFGTDAQKAYFADREYMLKIRWLDAVLAVTGFSDRITLVAVDENIEANGFSEIEEELSGRKNIIILKNG